MHKKRMLFKYSLNEKNLKTNYNILLETLNMPNKLEIL